MVSKWFLRELLDEKTRLLDEERREAESDCCA